MLFCLIFLSIVLIIILAGAVIDEEPQRTTVNLASPSVQRIDELGATYWVATLNVNKIRPKESNVLWNEVRVIVKASDGSVLNTMTSLDPDDPESYFLGTGEPEVNFWFVETSGDERMNAGDAIKVTGMGLEYEGAFVDLFHNGERIGSIVLPTNFP
jgi:hypothetical protein